MKKKILTIFLCSVMLLGLSGCDTKKKAEKDLEDTINKYGYVEKETVDALVAKFNTEVMDNSNGKMNVASEDYLTIDAGKYWYGLIEGIYLVVVPQEFNNDKTKEVVDNMTIYVDKSGKYEENAMTYVNYLIKANNSKFTNEEISNLIEDAKQKSVNNENANNGKGISIGYADNADNYQYIVKRLYK